MIKQKLSDNLVLEFRRWVREEHDAADVTIELLINFSQRETELEESLAGKSNNMAHESITPKRFTHSEVNQIRSELKDCCAICGLSSHWFIDCSKFKAYTLS